jgi:ribonuclease Z
VGGTRLAYQLEVKEIDEGPLFEDQYFTVQCQKLDHGILSYGFRIAEKDRPGELLADKLKTAGILPGPIYKQIKENERVTAPDGQTLHRRDFIGPDKKGKIISILGDTRFTGRNRDFVHDSDVLVHEATFGQEKAGLAEQYFHSTTAEAAALAEKAAVGKLVLTHISSRYQKEDYGKLLKEAQTIFPDTVLAEDFYRLPVSSKHGE